MTGNASKLLTNNGSAASWTAALSGLTTISQTGLHTLTSTSNTVTPVNSILFENLQVAQADTESGLADEQQLAPRSGSRPMPGTAAPALPSQLTFGGEPLLPA